MLPDTLQHSAGSREADGGHTGLEALLLGYQNFHRYAQWGNTTTSPSVWPPNLEKCSRMLNVEEGGSVALVSPLPLKSRGVPMRQKGDVGGCPRQGISDCGTHACIGVQLLLRVSWQFSFLTKCRWPVVATEWPIQFEGFLHGVFHTRAPADYVASGVTLDDTLPETESTGYFLCQPCD
jgi:hypothetical protein